MIRKYDSADLEPLLNIWYTATKIAHPFMTEAFLQKERENIRKIYIPNTKTWVYEDEGVVTGFISMLGNEIGAIFILPEYQGRGVGRSLVDHVSEFHKDLEVDVFKENTIGVPFYEKYGFSEMHQYQHEETGQVVIRMSFQK